MMVTTSDGCALDVRDSGPGSTGDTLVLVHGWSQSRATFDRVIPLLAPTHRVVSFDLRGHGLSGKPATGARVARLAADLHEVLDALAVDRACLVGHSLGASVAWSYLDTHGSSRVDSLVVVDQPSACAVLPWMTAEDGRDAGAILDVAGADAFVASLTSPESDAIRHAFLVSMLSPDIGADDVEWLYRENLRMPAAWGARLLFDHIMQDWRDVLPGIDVPTLVIGGAVSHVSTASQAWTADRIPGAELRVFTRAEGGSHFPFFENAASFAPVLLDFLAAHSVPSGAQRTAAAV